MATSIAQTEIFDFLVDIVPREDPKLPPPRANAKASGAVSEQHAAVLGALAGVGIPGLEGEGAWPEGGAAGHDPSHSMPTGL